MLKVNKINDENRRVEAIIISKFKATNVKDLRNIILNENEKELSIEVVNENGNGLKSNIEVQIKIEVKGHTDWPNMELSLQRSQEVVNYLIDKGISKNRLTAKGMSNKEPVAINNSEKNR